MNFQRRYNGLKSISLKRTRPSELTLESKSKIVTTISDFSDVKKSSNKTTYIYSISTPAEILLPSSDQRKIYKKKAEQRIVESVELSPIMNGSDQNPELEPTDENGIEIIFVNEVTRYNKSFIVFASLVIMVFLGAGTYFINLSHGNGKGKCFEDKSERFCKQNFPFF